MMIMLLHIYEKAENKMGAVEQEKGDNLIIAVIWEELAYCQLP